MTISGYSALLLVREEERTAVPVRSGGLVSRVEVLEDIEK